VQVSIGCGLGFLERILQTQGIETVGVDLDLFHSTPDQYLNMVSFLPNGIVRIQSSQLFDICEPHRTALLFCFGRRLPWQRYIEAYPSIHSAIVIGDTVPGDQGVTQPGAYDIGGIHQWKLVREFGEFRAVMRVICTAYANDEKRHLSMEQVTTPEHMDTIDWDSL
jgi:hypothetical protein